MTKVNRVWIWGGLLLALVASGCGKDVCEYDGQSYDRGEVREAYLCGADTGMYNECTCMAGGDWSCTDLGAICDTATR